MKLVFNTRLLQTQKLEGIGWFTYEILQRLVVKHPEVEFVFLFDRPYHSKFIFDKNVRAKRIPPPTRHPVLWKIWFDFMLPEVLKRENPDLFISPDGYISLRTKVKTLAVIHDINFEHHPEYIPSHARSYFLKYFRKFAHKATRLATVSEYSRQDIAQTYGISKTKIDLVYNGVGDFFTPTSKQEQEILKKEISRGQDYFVFIGALNPRKNIDGMFKAYEQYRNEGGTKLFVVVGAKMFWNEEIEDCYQNHSYKEDILFVGRMEGKELNKVLSASSALLFVSHFEGFGIPILEAFRCRVPVITADNSSMPEVAGDAAILCDSNNLAQIAKAMHKIEDSSFIEELTNKAFLRSQDFSWDKSADMLWESIQKTIANG